MTCIALLGIMVLATCVYGGETPIPDEFKTKREEVFEFTRRPAVTREGDRMSITFEAKGLCDVSVAVEDAAGRIIRHLASGVLGPRAPDPFQRDSRTQTVVWDSKDDQGVYVDNKDSLTVRVSLGLKPQFERTLFWSPYKRIGINSPLIAAAPEGVYVFEGCGLDSLRLYDHGGTYLRTVYPFPADKLAGVQGLDWREFPQDGQRLPVKTGPKHCSTLLAARNPLERTGHDKGGAAASAVAVQGMRIALVSGGLCRMATDGGTPPGQAGGLDLGVPEDLLTLDGGGKPRSIHPRSAAFSPDGRRLYLTGFPIGGGDWLHAVMRLDYEKAGKPELFAGSLKPRENGSDDAHFDVPISVACDPAGNVFVADYMNDRIKIFTPDGQLRKSVRVAKPVHIGVHPRTQEIYVGSWMIVNRSITSDKIKIEATFMRLKSMDEPKVLASCTLPLNEYNPTISWNRFGGLQYNLAFDFFTDPPALWVVPGILYSVPSGTVIYKTDLAGTGITLYTEGAGKLVARRDFNNDVVKNPLVVRAKPANGGGGAGPRQRLYANPKSGRLYVGEADCGDSKAFNQLVEIDPDTGTAKLMDLPMATEDLAIDLNGLFYLRSDVEVARFEPGTWREIPWDYGEQRASAGFGSTGARMCRLISGLILPGTGRYGWWHMGGIAVSPKGHLAVTCGNATKPPDLRETGEWQTGVKAGFKVRNVSKYTPKLYPGRQTGWEMHVWDEHGKVVCQDATPGIGITDGIGLDKDDNLYIMANGNRMLDGKPYFLKWGETYLKAGAGKMKAITAGKGPAVPAEGAALPSRPPDMQNVWVEGAEWFYGGVGFNGGASGASCICWNTRPALDLYARSFLPEIDHFSVAVLDTAGNLILRVGKYGNVDDGAPMANAERGTGNAELTQDQRSGNAPRAALRVPRSLGGDEVALFHAPYLATHTDRRLFIADIGNARILSVKLGYHAEERIPLSALEVAPK